MPELENYKITNDDGTEQILQLDSDDVERWEALAKDKGSPVKSIAKANPVPFNK